MKKMIFTLLVILIPSMALFAQDLSVGASSIDKVDRPCVLAVYNMSSSIVSEALSDKLKESSVGKGSKAKGGFRAYKGVSIPEISEDKIDIYTKVSGKKDNSTMYIAVSRGYDNFISPETDAETVEMVKNYIKSMMKNVNIANLKVEIAEQAKVVKKADKEKGNVETAGERLVSEQKSLEEKIVENKKDQEANKKELAKAQEELKAEETKLAEIKAKLESLVK